MNLNIKEKVIIVTGGSRGIGAAIAESLALENAISVIVSRNDAENQLVIEKIMAVGGMAHSIEAELTNPADCERAVRMTIERYGRIDGLVNEAKTNEGATSENDNYQAHDSLIVEYASPYLKKTKGPVLNITVNITEIREKTNREIADMVTFLMSSRSSHTTGQIIYIDGGYVYLDRAILK